MKKNRTIVVLILLLGMFFILNSCVIEGCTDPSASNYNPKADINDGTCVYSGGTGGGGTGGGDVTFWARKNFFCGNIKVTIPGYGSRVISSYYPSGISGCNKNGCANFTLPPKTYYYKASCSQYTWSGNVTVSPNGCFRMELTD